MHGIVQEQLVGARIPNVDGSFVTYDLTENVGYLTPKELGIALSETFFKNDGIHWFSAFGKTVHFSAVYRVRILFPESYSRESRATMSYFYYNLENVIIPKQFAEQLKGSFGTMFGLAGRTRESIYAAELKNNIMENIDIEFV